MFCQVRVNEESREYLRFLLWVNGYTSRQPNKFKDENPPIWSNVVSRMFQFGAESAGKRR